MCSVIETMQMKTHKKRTSFPSRKETLNVNSGWVWIMGIFFTVSQFICNEVILILQWKLHIIKITLKALKSNWKTVFPSQTFQEQSCPRRPSAPSVLHGLEFIYRSGEVHGSRLEPARQGVPWRLDPLLKVGQVGLCPGALAFRMCKSY